MKVLITGGRGGLGRMLVRSVSALGHEVRVMSRQPRPDSTPIHVEWAQADLASNTGVGASLEGIGTVIHSASDPRNADAVDVTGTKHLLDGASSAKVAHLIYISIVGIDQIDYGYYQKKLAAERIIESRNVPYSILRATQFHSLLNSLISAAARLPLIMPLAPDFKFQSVAEMEVADQLVRIVDAAPQGRLPDFGGPDVLSLRQMAETWMEVTRVRRWILGLPLPGSVAAAFRAGKNTAPQGVRGNTTWLEWLRRRYRDKAS